MLKFENVSLTDAQRIAKKAYTFDGSSSYLNFNHTSCHGDVIAVDTINLGVGKRDVTITSNTYSDDRLREIFKGYLPK